MLVLDCGISEKDWLQQVQRDGHFLWPAKSSDSTKQVDAGPWESAVQKIVSFQELEADWDGYGAEAPSRELLASAIGLACLFAKCGIAPPQCVVPGTDGSVNFEWQDADGAMAEVEIDRPFHAQVMIIEPGKQPKFWDLPTA